MLAVIIILLLVIVYYINCGDVFLPVILFFVYVIVELMLMV